MFFREAKGTARMADTAEILAQVAQEETRNPEALSCRDFRELARAAGDFYGMGTGGERMRAYERSALVAAAAAILSRLHEMDGEQN